MTLYQGGRGSHGEPVEPWQWKPPHARFDTVLPKVTSLTVTIRPRLLQFDLQVFKKDVNGREKKINFQQSLNDVVSRRERQSW